MQPPEISLVSNKHKSHKCLKEVVHFLVPECAPAVKMETALHLHFI